MEELSENRDGSQRNTDTFEWI